MAHKHIPHLLEMLAFKGSIFALMTESIFRQTGKNEIQQLLENFDDNFLTVFYSSLQYHETGVYERIKDEEILWSSKKYISRTRQGQNAKQINLPEELLISDFIDALYHIKYGKIPDEITEITSVGAAVLIEVLSDRLPELEIKKISENFLESAGLKLITTDNTDETGKNRYNQRYREFYRHLEKELLKILNQQNNEHEIKESTIINKFKTALGKIRQGYEKSKSEQIAIFGESQSNYILDELEEREEFIEAEPINIENIADHSRTENKNRFKYFAEFRTLFRVIKYKLPEIEKAVKKKNINPENFHKMQKLNYNYSLDFKKSFNAICETEPQNYERLYFKKDDNANLQKRHERAIELIKTANNEFAYLDNGKQNTGKYIMEIIFCLDFFKIDWLKALHAVAFQYTPEISQKATEMGAYLSIKSTEISQITKLFPDYGKKNFLIDGNQLFKKMFLENLNRYRNAFETKLKEMLKLYS